LIELKKSITFFYTDGVEKQTVQPLVEEAKKLGYKVKLTNNVLEKAEIGVYCQHVCFPENSKFSVIMLHDLGQGHNRWPNIWLIEPWDKFDIGILPGKIWSERWQSCSAHPYTRPKVGVFELGWPKADIIFQKGKEEKKNKEILDLKEHLNLSHPLTVLYVPSWENDAKQDEFVQSLKELPVNLLLKQAPWSDDYPEILENIKTMNELHYNYKSNVHIIDPAVNIMYCLELADIIVSEESSVLIEGLLLDIPAVAVTDWRIPDCSPPRLPSIPFDFVIKTKKEDLQETIKSILDDIEQYKNQLSLKKDDYFSYLGDSAVHIMNVIDRSVADQTHDIKAIPATKSLKKVPLKLQIKRWLSKQKSKLKIRLGRI